MKSVWKDLRWGTGWGLFIGVFYAIIGSAIYLFKDSPEVGYLNLPSLVALYLLAGVGGGAIVGLFRPLIKRRIGAILVGIVAMLPMGTGSIMLYKGPISGWGALEVISVIGGSILLGGVGGSKLWTDLHDFDPRAWMQERERSDSAKREEHPKRKRRQD